MEGVAVGPQAIARRQAKQNSHASATLPQNRKSALAVLVNPKAQQAPPLIAGDAYFPACEYCPALARDRGHSALPANPLLAGASGECLRGALLRVDARWKVDRTSHLQERTYLLRA